MKINSVFILIFASLLWMGQPTSLAQEVGVNSHMEPPPDDNYVPPELFTDVYRDDLYAILKTSEGTMKVHLVGRDSPKNVQNFINLARGAKEHIDLTGARSFSRFYDGLTFHKVLHNFVVQAGCPRGNGTGGPGFVVPDEINSKNRLDIPGVMAMANYGPNTNGSQFFITTGENAYLNERYTVLGKVVEGMDVLMRINDRIVDGLARPTYPVVIERIDIMVGDKII